jgi:hypothetical protein
MLPSPNASALAAEGCSIPGPTSVNASSCRIPYLQNSEGRHYWAVADTAVKPFALLDAFRSISVVRRRGGGAIAIRELRIHNQN